MQRLGIGYDALRAANGGIILASVSSQGENGPDADNISFGSTLEATSGLAALTAYEDGVPLVTGHGTELSGSGRLGVCRRGYRRGLARDRALWSGRASRYLAARTHDLSVWQRRSLSAAAPEDSETASPEYLLQDTFATQDGWVAVSIRDEPELALVLALAAPAMAGSNSYGHHRCQECVARMDVWTRGPKRSAMLLNANAVLPPHRCSTGRMHGTMRSGLPLAQSDRSRDRRQAIS